MAEKCFTGVVRQLFINDYDHTLGKYNMTGIVLLPDLKDDDQANYFHSAESISNDHNVCHESDENDYDSDCSLGSMNYLYLSLKKDPDRPSLNETDEKNMIQLNNENNNMNRTSKISEHNFVLKNRILKKQKAYNKTDTKSEKKLSTNIFYGKKVPVTRQWLHCTRKYKIKSTNSKLRKTKTSVYRFQQKINKLCASSKQHKHRNLLNFKRVLTTKKIHKNNSKLIKENTNLIRNQLKKPIPLLKFNHHTKIKNTQKNNEYSLTNTVEKNQTNFITVNDILEKENDYIKTCDSFEKTRIFESNVVNQQKFITTDDFEDIEDFEDTKVIEGIINKLYDEDNETNEQSKNELQRTN